MHSIKEFITGEETAYSLPIILEDKWDWCMKDHIKTAILYKNSKYTEGTSDRPFKNIVRPILNVQYRAEGFDVKDIQIYVDSPEQFHKSFLIRKFHEKWARENDLDTFIDEMVESYVDYGGALVKNVDSIRPEVVSMKSIAFCDQTDLLSGPLGIKHFFSPSELLKQADVGWGDEKNGATISLEELIAVAQTRKDRDSQTTDTPGKYIEVYEIHGDLPEYFLNDNDSDEYITQMHIIAMYKDDKDHKTYVTLYKKEEKEIPFKLVLRDEIFGRALGLGGVEELIDPQVWTNYAMIRKRDMLDSASKTIMQTDDDTVVAKHPSGLKDVENMEIIEVEEGKKLAQVDTFPRNITLFDRSVEEWQIAARSMGAANEAILGETPKAGTPFRLQALITQESHSLHNYRKGKLATFLGEIYTDWIIPHLAKEIVKEQKFMAELTLDEMQEVVRLVAKNRVNERIKEQILDGIIPDRENMESFRRGTEESFMQSNKKFIEILKDEMKKIPLNVKINIVGKQEYLQFQVENLVNIFRQIMAAPQILSDPNMAKLFHTILESSGITPIHYGAPPIHLHNQSEKIGVGIQPQQPTLEPLKVKEPQAV